MHKTATAIRIAVLALVVGLLPGALVALIVRAEMTIAPALSSPPVQRLAISSPAAGAVLSAEGPAPVFRWRDDSGRTNAWRITIAFHDGAEPFRTTVRRTQWQPAPDQWRAIAGRRLDTHATVVIRGVCDGGQDETVTFGAVSLVTSGGRIAATARR